jgi:hypothetical protein
MLRENWQHVVGEVDRLVRTDSRTRQHPCRKSEHDATQHGSNPVRVLGSTAADTHDTISHATSPSCCSAFAVPAAGTAHAAIYGTIERRSVADPNLAARQWQL